jgi:hypothetical protein
MGYGRKNPATIKIDNPNVAELESQLAQIVTNVKIFGAKGDGTTDDTTAIQSALDYCSTNGLTLFFPNGEYKINSSLVLKGGRTYKIIGANNGIDAFSNNNKCKISCYADKLFISDNVAVIVNIAIDISGLFIRQMSASTSSVLFSGLNLEASKIHHLSVLNFGTIIKGQISGVTHVHHNFIENISNCFITYFLVNSEATITDSWVSDNYLNGNPSYNITMFKNGYTNYANIENNFIDFCKYVYSSLGGSQNVKFIGNTFDVCFRFSPTEINANFIGNTFSKFSKATYISRFPNADTDMNTLQWCVFGSGLYWTTIEGNIISECDSFYYMDTSFNNHDLKIANNTFLVPQSNLPNMYNIHYYVDTSNTNDYKNIYIDDLMYKKYSSLPLIRTNEHMYFFPNQIIDYNGKLLRLVGTAYNNMQWVDFMGNVVVA